MTASEDVHVSGHCYCGGVTFDVDIPAGGTLLFSTFCHCDSCRRAHAAPLYQVACVDASMFRLTAGADRLVRFNKGGHITRAFCGTCGSRILNSFGDWKPGGRTPIAFFPDLLDAGTRRALPAIFRTQKHNCPDECVLDAEALAKVLG